jgi:predicted small lipoprotein YifL
MDKINQKVKRNAIEKKQQSASGRIICLGVIIAALMLNGCGIYQRKYTHGLYFPDRDVVTASNIEKSESEKEKQSEKEKEKENLNEYVIFIDTIVPLPLPQAKTPPAMPMPQEKKDTVSPGDYKLEPIEEEFTYPSVERLNTPSEEQISKQIDKTFKADYATIGIPFLGWGIFRLALINQSFRSPNFENFILLFFTLAMLLAMAYMVTFILSLVWGFDTQSKIQKYFKNHQLYDAWKERNSWSIILAFLGLLSPIISFILFWLSFG